MASELDYGIDLTQSGVAVVSSQFMEEFDDNFFGDQQDLSSEDSLIVLTEDTMINPFYVELRGGKMMGMSDRDIYKQYKRVLILCCLNQNADRELLTEKIINKVDYQNVAQDFTLIPGSIKMIKNKMHRYQATIIESHLLEPFNNSGVELENDEVVLTLLELNSSVAQAYIDLYTSDYKLQDLVQAKLLQQYYNCNKYCYPVQAKISRMSNGLDESIYWTNPYNCNINLTDSYIKRQFQYRESSRDTVKAAITAQSKKQNSANVQTILNKLMAKTENQYAFMHIRGKEVFTDASDAVKGSKYRLYRIDNDRLTLNKKQVTELFSMTSNDRELYDLFNAFLLSKQYCHLVINNDVILRKVSPIIEKFKPVYKCLFGYAWLCMYMEECIMKTRTNRENRYVFDINTASNLPFFPYCTDDVHMNPYCALLVNENVLNSKKNCHGIPMIKGYDNYGIDTLDNFKRKFNIFTTNNSTRGIFDGLETEEGSNRWKHFAVSGSLIPSCAEKCNPLMELVTTANQTYEERWTRFFNEYQADSDIDLMCNQVGIFDFMDCVDNMINVVTNNLNEIAGKDVSDTIAIKPIKTLMIIVNTAYVEECMSDDFDPTYVLNNFNDDDIKDYFHLLYANKKSKDKRKWRKENGTPTNPLYKYFFKTSPQDDMNIILSTYSTVKNQHTKYDSDTYIYLNDVRDADNQVPEEENIQLLKISESIKFKITSPHLPHCIEAFKIKYAEYFSCVARFHLPCVRGYYDGDNVYMLPSCITALMTHMNIDYKYFAGVRNPIEIINKYRMRGYGTILNDIERSHMLEYNGNVDQWKEMFSLNLSDKESKSNHFGAIKLTEQLYRPGQILRGFPVDTYTLQDDREYITTVDDLYQFYQEQYGYDAKNSGFDLLQHKTIKEDGTVQPIKRWFLDAAYDTLSEH